MDGLVSFYSKSYAVHESLAWGAGIELPVFPLRLPKRRLTGRQLMSCLRPAIYVGPDVLSLQLREYIQHRYRTGSNYRGQWRRWHQ